MSKDHLLAARTLNEMSELEKEQVFEALIFASKEPIQKKELVELFGTEQEVKKLIDKLKSFYKDRGIELFTTDKSIAFRTSVNIADIASFPIIEKKKIPKAALETLTIIAYYQPVTRPDIEKIRGVSISKGTLDLLIDERWISVGRRRKSPGQPATFVTTETFLDHFGLSSIQDLPGISELKEAGFANVQLPLE